MYKIIYSKEANNDLVAIFNYIADDSKDRAIVYLGKIEKTILQLVHFPQLGKLSRFTELSLQGIYLLSHDKYLIFYRIKEESKQIQVIRVLHGSRDYARLF